MLTYFDLFFIQMIFGPGYCLSQIAIITGAVLLFTSRKKDRKSVLPLAAEMLALFGAKIALSCLFYYFFGLQWLEEVTNAIVLSLYAILRCRYSMRTRVVRFFIYYTVINLAAPISEPIGELFWALGDGYRWGEYFTPAVVALIIFTSVWYLRKFSNEKLMFTSLSPAILIVLISVISFFLTMVARSVELGEFSKLLNVLLPLSFLALEYLSYYLYHMVGIEYSAKLEATALGQKEDLDREMMQVSLRNYEELHEMRHEIKNHMTYLGVLCNQGDLQGVRRYLETASDATESLFSFVECGNDIINAVMNHAISQAKASGVKVETTIVVPPQLPFNELDLCSLLSNLMDNAIEAACQSGAENPSVSVSIRPQQDYLFLRVTNPVDDSVPKSSRLSLNTIKNNPEAHGYGTKIIRRIAERYHGSVKFDIRDDRFVVDVMLLLAEDK